MAFRIITILLGFIVFFQLLIFAFLFASFLSYLTFCWIYFLMKLLLRLSIALVLMCFRLNITLLLLFMFLIFVSFTNLRVCNRLYSDLFVWNTSSSYFLFVLLLSWFVVFSNVLVLFLIVFCSVGAINSLLHAFNDWRQLLWLGKIVEFACFKLRISLTISGLL